MASILNTNNNPTHAVKGPGIIGNTLPAMPSKAKKDRRQIILCSIGIVLKTRYKMNKKIIVF